MGPGGQRMEIEASLDNLQLVRAFLKEQAAACGLPYEAAMDLITAADEALTNIVVHGYQHDPDRRIEVEAEADDDGITVRLLDRAPRYDPTARPEPDLSIPLHRRPVGGLGIYMMKQSVDEITYQPRPGGGNILTLRKAR